MRKLELDLLDVTTLIENDPSGELLKVKLLPTNLKFCTTAENYLKSKKKKSSSFLCCKTSMEERNLDEFPNNLNSKKQQEKINKYLKVSDRYLHLISLLMKSREFHLYHNNDVSTEEGKDKKKKNEDGDNRVKNDNIIVELPRTEKGKPYISIDERGMISSSSHDFSISHQNPFVGIGRNNGGSKVGIDIVIFEDKINERLYRNEDEFLNVFQSSFAKCEWTYITQSANKLREFYLHWSVKEAYTKALGLGFHLEFNSFSTEFEGGVHSNLHENVLIAANKQQQPNMQGGEEQKIIEEGICLHGTIHHNNEHKKNENWGFFFLPLSSIKNVQGCVCACIPIDDYDDQNHEEKIMDVVTRWLDAEELLNT